MDGAEDDDVPDFEVPNVKNLSAFRVTVKKVRKVLDSLNPSKSVNGLSPRVLKECSDVLALPICRLFKKIVKSCTWPSKWKIGRVSPIWKRESKSEAKNYRPVTVLDNLSLVMERVLDEQLCNFTDCFIPNNQFGFKKRCGTDDFAIALTTEMHLALEAELEALLVALDVAGAFDKVWWKALLHKLKKCGCKGRALKLLESYFKDRFLYVVAMGIASSLKEFFSGVPQGGIWSPKLWNFYIQDLSLCFILSKLFKYADDCTALKTFKNSDRHLAMVELNQDLKRASRWGRRWKTTFEPKKTHAMLATNSKDCYHPEINQVEFDGVKVGFETELKIVGVIYDNKLNWSKMASEMASRGRRALGFLRRLGGLISKADLSTIYKYFVRSKMEYGCVSYLGAAPSHLKRLDATQLRAEKLTGFEFQPLASRREAACFGLLCKLLSGECVEPLQQMCPDFKLEQNCGGAESDELIGPNSTRSSRNKLQVTDMIGKLRSGTSLEPFRRSFIAQAHNIFNKIPEDIKQRGEEKGWMTVLKDGQRFLSKVDED